MGSGARGCSSAWRRSGRPGGIRRRCRAARPGLPPLRRPLANSGCPRKGALAAFLLLRSPAALQLRDLLVRPVFAQGVDGPEGRRNPAQQRDLQKQADDARDGPADGEEHREGKEYGQQEAHGGPALSWGWRGTGAHQWVGVCR